MADAQVLATSDICGQCEEVICQDCRIANFTMSKKSRIPIFTLEIYHDKFIFCQQACNGKWVNNFMFCYTCDRVVCLDYHGLHIFKQHCTIAISDANFKYLKQYGTTGRKINELQEILGHELEQLYKFETECTLCNVFPSASCLYKVSEQILLNQNAKDVRFIQNCQTKLKKEKTEFEALKTRNPLAIALSQILSGVETKLQQLTCEYNNYTPFRESTLQYNLKSTNIEDLTILLQHKGHKCSSNVERQTIDPFVSIFDTSRSRSCYEDNKRQRFRYKLKIDDMKNELQEKDNTINALKSKIMKLNNQLHAKDQQQEDEISEIKGELLESFQVERDSIQMRLDNVVDEVKELTMNNLLLQSENMKLRSKLQDVKIQFNEWNTISSKISSIFDRNVTAGDLEEENQNLKETIQRMNGDKMRLENEVSITLKKLLKTREDCDNRTKRYDKGELVNCMMDESGYTTESAENVPLSSVSYADNVFQEKEHDFSTVEHGMTQTQVATNPASNIRHISSDKNIYNFTAATVNFIKSSTVGLEKRMAIDNTTDSNTPMEIEN